MRYFTELFCCVGFRNEVHCKIIEQNNFLQKSASVDDDFNGIVDVDLDVCGMHISLNILAIS